MSGRARLPAIAILSAGILSASGVVAQRRGAQPVPVYGYQIVRSYPHDPHAFTQGLVYHAGFLYEGTGLNGRSSIRKVKLESGEVLQIQNLDQQYFGEGITVWQDSIVQLTWQSQIGFVYDLATFGRKRSFAYRGEGWGLTHDGTRLIMSDGQPDGTLRYIDPLTMKEAGRLPVRDGTRPVVGLNELEFIKGEIFANVWNTHRIARISATTGQVTGWIDLTGLLSPREAVNVDVLNGIAYDAIGDRLFVTGKLWPRVFEIRVIPRR
jgi:glutamine cyclotransferase